MNYKKAMFILSLSTVVCAQGQKEKELKLARLQQVKHGICYIVRGTKNYLGALLSGVLIGGMVGYLAGSYSDTTTMSTNDDLFAEIATPTHGLLAACAGLAAARIGCDKDSRFQYLAYPIALVAFLQANTITLFRNQIAIVNPHVQTSDTAAHALNLMLGSWLVASFVLHKLAQHGEHAPEGHQRPETLDAAQ